MKKIISIVGYSLGENSFGVTKPYLEFFSQFGQVKILTPQEGMEKTDLLILPGGSDLSSIEYGQVPGFMNSNPDLYKEYFFKQNLKQYIESGTPIYGICLGFQMLAVYFGSKLTQNLLYHPYYSSPRTELVHEVYPVTGINVDGEYTYKKGSKGKEIKVNSMHHQGVELDNLGLDLIPTYLCDNYPSMLVEGFRHKELPIAGCQSHPEESWSNEIINEIETLLNFKEETIQ